MSAQERVKAVWSSARDANGNPHLYGYTFKCPGCGYSHTLPVGEGDGGKRPRWTFNGDLEKPVFRPSILSQFDMSTPPVTPENLEEWKRAPWPQKKVRHVCHSFVGINGAEPGQIIFLGDCTHAMKGQVVDLPVIECKGADIDADNEDE